VLGPDRVELDLRASDGSTEQHVLPPAYLPAALVELVGLGPRPRPPEQRRIPAAELAAAVARPDEQDLLPGPLVLWRVERPPRALEILDTGEGLFMVEAEDSGAVLHPTTPGRAFRGLVRLAQPG
jgi:hypothetical protein